MAAFYRHIPVAHVEAGLRTWDLEQPFPEELSRATTGRLAALHFAPTAGARRNLLVEGIPGGFERICEGPGAVGGPAGGGGRRDGETVGTDPAKISGEAALLLEGGDGNGHASERIHGAIEEYLGLGCGTEHKARSTNFSPRKPTQQNRNHNSES